MQTRTKRRRMADDITAGMQQLQKMMAEGKTPAEMPFTIRTVEVPAPHQYRPAEVLKLRQKLGVSQAVFARLVGVSTILVQSWEGGQRTPAPLARRLLDTIVADPAGWLELIKDRSKRSA